jgi:hypothetical protein
VWLDLPNRRQRLLASYVLSAPLLFTLISLMSLAAIITSAFLNAPVGLVMLMYLPLIPNTLLVALNVVFLHDFGKAFNRTITLRQYVLMLLTYYPYTVVLNAAALWSIVRELRGDNSWYKTAHSGLHREQPAFATAAVPVTITDSMFANPRENN